MHSNFCRLFSHIHLYGYLESLKTWKKNTQRKTFSFGERIDNNEIKSNARTCFSSAPRTYQTLFSKQKFWGENLFSFFILALAACFCSQIISSQEKTLLHPISPSSISHHSTFSGFEVFFSFFFSLRWPSKWKSVKLLGVIGMVWVAKAQN